MMDEAEEKEEARDLRDFLDEQSGRPLPGYMDGLPLPE